MSDPAAFVLASLLLLATPGPTNTLLLTSAAAVGLRRSLRLIGGELAGYFSAFVLLTVVVGPVVRGSVAADTGLRLLCGGYLLVLAIGLWRSAERGGVGRADPIGWRDVFVTTLLNPKAGIFAFAVVPYAVDGDFVAAAPYLAGLGVLIVTVALGWLSVGAGLAAGFGTGGRWLTPALACRCGAVAIAVLAMVVSGSAITTLLAASA